MSENEYKELVLAAFDRELTANRISQELVLPTAGTLKAEAVKVCGKRFDSKDEIVLSSFITAERGIASHLRAIQNCDYQIFKPLSNFLNKREKGTAFKNIQLLAWLIDFKPRPFNPELKVPLGIKQEPEPIIIVSVGNGGEKNFAENEQLVPGNDTNPSTEIKGEEPTVLIPVEPDEKKKPKGQAETVNKKINQRWLIGFAVLLIGGVIWRFIPASGNCMYWNDDHYVATSCSVPRLDTPLIYLDQAKLRGFRRIKLVDTLTSYSVGRLWYVRIGDSIEVYSGGGRHPLYPDKKLKEVTDYVVNFCRNHRH